MPESFRTRRRVEFRDTDAAGIMHFSAFFDYMENAEHEFWRSLGMSVLPASGGRHLSWPRVAARCQFREMVRFEDELDMVLRAVRVGEKSVTYQWTFLRDQQPVADGEITAVCCRFDPGAAPQSVPIPDEIRRKLAPFAGTAGLPAAES